MEQLSWHIGVSCQSLVSCLVVSCQRWSLDSHIVTFCECVTSYIRCKEVCHWCVFKVVEFDRSLSMSAELEEQGFV